MTVDNQIELAVNLMNGETATKVLVSLQDLISSLKTKIEKAEGTPAWQQQLFLEGICLQDAESLNKYCESLAPGCGVTLIRKRLFMPSATFEGSEPGYKFTMGEHGLGYYVDDYEQNRDQAAPVDDWDGYWHVTQSCDWTVVIERGFIYWSGFKHNHVTTQIEKSESDTEAFSTQLPKSGIAKARLVADTLVWDGEPDPTMERKWTRAK
jgi:hypothetical protein